MKRVFAIMYIYSIISVMFPYSVFAQSQSSGFQVDVLWEAVGSYTPPFYKGKALPPLEANINVVAIPTGQTAPTAVYTWEKDYQKQAGQSGNNKNYFGYSATPLDQETHVSVSVGSGNSVASNDVTIRYGNSEVLFYENDPEYGTLFNRSISNGFNVNQENGISLTAIPYFLTTKELTSDAINMIWSINGNALPEQKIKNKIRLEGQPGSGGESVISIFIQNTTRLFEEGEVGIKLTF